MPFADELSVALTAARAAADLIRQRAATFNRADARTKTRHDLVTDVDEASQALILGHLREAFPDDAILAEEGGDDGVAPLRVGRRWIVDPLDGTTNFAHGVPPYAVSIALEEAGEIVVGVVHEVTSDEVFSATRGGGLAVDGEPAEVSDTVDLDHALLSTGFPFRDYSYAEGYLQTFETLMRATRGIRRHGSAAMDLAWTAAGRFDGFFEGGLAPWDVAAGVLLVREAGGTVTGLDGAAHPVFSGGLVASPPALHPVLLDACRPLAESFGRR
ncbi:MAG TPA: inositol monophosphatase [Bacteroidetes bacterium]|nr:inositol monophosphatase [Bacteroidota bacterium]HIL57973.1 inositol monophosphatase [Rhodothermales bacterium]